MSRVRRWLINGLPRTPVLGLIHDLSWAALAPLIAVMIRNDFSLSPDEVDGTILYVSVSFLTATLVFPLFAMRLDIWEFTTLPDMVRVLVAVMVSVVVTSFIVFVINRHAGVARSVPLLHFLLLLAPLLSGRILVKRFHRKRQHKHAQRAAPAFMNRRVEHVLLFGVNSLAEFYANAVSELSQGGVEIVGIVSNDDTRHGRRLCSHPVLGHAKHLPHFLQEFSVRGVEVNKIVICMRWEEIPSATQKILRHLEGEEKIRIELMDDILRLVRDDQVVVQNHANEKPAVSAARDDQVISQQLPNYFKLKRFIDLTVASTCALMALPLIALMALANKIALGDPVLFWQKRPGRHGLNFCVYKFRTMLAPYDDEGNRIEDERRQTTLTRLVRRSRLDELPQLYNIISGEMSLIGPRPLLPKDQPKGTNARLAIAPGITGWAQVNGGDLISPDEKLALDLWYVHHASLWLDIKIIYMTVLTVLYGDRRNDEAVRQATAELAVLYPQLKAGRTETAASADGPRLPEWQSEAGPSPASSG